MNDKAMHDVCLTLIILIFVWVVGGTVINWSTLDRIEQAVTSRPAENPR